MQRACPQRAGRPRGAARGSAVRGRAVEAPGRPPFSAEGRAEAAMTVARACRWSARAAKGRRPPPQPHPRSCAREWAARSCATLPKIGSTRHRPGRPSSWRGSMSRTELAAGFRQVQAADRHQDAGVPVHPAGQFAGAGQASVKRRRQAQQRGGTAAATRRGAAVVARAGHGNAQSGLDRHGFDAQSWRTAAPERPGRIARVWYLQLPCQSNHAPFGRRTRVISHTGLTGATEMRCFAAGRRNTSDEMCQPPQ